MTKLKEHSREICYSRLQFAWSKHWLLTSWLLTCVHDIEGFPCHSSTLCVEGGARAEEVLRTGNSRNPGLSATSFIHPSPSNEAWVLPDGWLRMSLFAIFQVQTEAQSGPVCTLHCHSYLGLCDDKDYYSHVQCKGHHFAVAIRPSYVPCYNSKVQDKSQAQSMCPLLRCRVQSTGTPP